MNGRRTSALADDEETEQLLLQLMHSHQNQASRLLQRVLQFVQNRTDFGRQADLSSLQQIVNKLLNNDNSNKSSSNDSNNNHYCCNQQQSTKVTAAKISGCGGGCMTTRMTTRSMHEIAQPPQSEMAAAATSTTPLQPPPPKSTQSTCHVTSCDSLHKSSFSSSSLPSLLPQMQQSTAAAEGTIRPLWNQRTDKLPFQQRIYSICRQQQPQSVRDDRSHWVTFESPNSNNRTNESVAQCTCASHENDRQWQTVSNHLNHQNEPVKPHNQINLKPTVTVGDEKAQHQHWQQSTAATTIKPAQSSKPTLLTTTVALSEQSNDPETRNGYRVFKPDGRVWYSWSQSLHETELLLPMSPEIRRGSQCRVYIRTHSLTVLINEHGVWQHRLDGRLRYPVRPDRCFWTLQTKRHLHVMLEKAEPRWWTSVLEGEISLERI